MGSRGVGTTAGASYRREAVADELCRPVGRRPIREPIQRHRVAGFEPEDEREVGVTVDVPRILDVDRPDLLQRKGLLTQPHERPIATDQLPGGAVDHDLPVIREPPGQGDERDEEAERRQEDAQAGDRGRRAVPGQ